jgi:hypothetical protein
VIDAGTMRLLVQLQGLTVPEEDLEPLAAALSSLLEANLRVLEAYGGSDSEPSPVFDPRWG